MKKFPCLILALAAFNVSAFSQNSIKLSMYEPFDFQLSYNGIIIGLLVGMG